MFYKLALFATGPNPDNWTDLQTLLGQMNIPVGITSSYVPYSEINRDGNGLRSGRGMAKAILSFGALADYRRSLLRSFCPAPAISSKVYLRTRSNEKDVNDDPVWIDCLAIMHWPLQEDQQGQGTLNFNIEFDILEEV